MNTAELNRCGQCAIVLFLCYKSHYYFVVGLFTIKIVDAIPFHEFTEGLHGPLWYDREHQVALRKHDTLRERFYLFFIQK